jgi:hypothetical protein
MIDISTGCILMFMSFTLGIIVGFIVRQPEKEGNEDLIRQLNEEQAVNKVKLVTSQLDQKFQELKKAIEEREEESKNGV